MWTSADGRWPRCGRRVPRSKPKAPGIEEERGRWFPPGNESRWSRENDQDFDAGPGVAIGLRARSYLDGVCPGVPSAGRRSSTTSVQVGIGPDLAICNIARLQRCWASEMVLSNGALSFSFGLPACITLEA